MKNKVRKPLFAIISIILLSTCGSVNIVKEQSDVDNEYLKQQYGEGTNHFAAVVTEYGFKSIMTAIKNGIIEDKKLDDASKEAEVEKLNAMKYIKNGYLAFEIITYQPLYKKQYNLKFRIYDNKGTVMVLPIHFVSLKKMWARKYGSGIYYDYIWMFRLRKPLDTMQPDELPLKMSVTYPNNRTNIYSIKP